MEEEAGEFAARMRAGVIASRPRPVEELFEWVYAELPETLRRQRDEALEFARRNGRDGSEAEHA